MKTRRMTADEAYKRIPTNFKYADVGGSETILVVEEHFQEVLVLIENGWKVDRTGDYVQIRRRVGFFGPPNAYRSLLPEAPSPPQPITVNITVNSGVDPEKVRKAVEDALNEALHVTSVRVG